MTNIFKIKKYWITTVGMMLFSFASLAQEYSDETIGFDVARITASLKEHGVADQDLLREISRMREQYKKQHSVMKKSEDQISQRITSELVSKTNQLANSKLTNKTANTLVEEDVPQSEKDALLALYNSTSGNTWSIKTGWDFSKPVTSWVAKAKTGWYGITVNEGHIIRIDLPKNNLFGPIPTQLSQLTHLTALDFDNNRLSGSIPIQIGELIQLEYLGMNSNELNGSIPSQIGQLAQLKYLDLSFNRLSGILPPEIGQLTQLQYLFSRNNLLTEIPSQIGQLTQLKSLNLYYNRLNGSIPSQIGQLAQLESLNLAGNELGGTIPISIGYLTNLTSLYLNQNQLTGNLPVEIGKLPHLENLILYLNQLSGTIPLQIGQLTKLKELNLAVNQFSGSLPSQIGKLSQIQIINLGGNQFSGSIPSEIGQLSQLNVLYLSNNQFSGLIPSEIGQLSELTSLSLSDNKFSGSIPSKIGQLNNLRNLFLQSNQLSGSIPVSIGSLTNLTTLYLSQNQLTGSLPAEIGNLTQLQNLSLSHNQITGITKEIKELQQLEVLDIGYNKIKSIPAEISQIINLYTININDNQLSGNLLDLGSITYLEGINIVNNNFRFVDLSGQFLNLKNSLDDFFYSPQSKTDIEKTIARAIGENLTLTMYEDNRFTPADTYQWYKNGQPIAGATSRQYTLSNLSLANAGDYYCISTNPQITGLTLTRNTIHLNVITCGAPITGTINSPQEEFCNTKESTFSFASNAVNLTYNWSATTTANVVVNTMKGDTSGTYKYTFVTPGSYTIKAEVIEATGCKTTFTKTITVAACDFESACINKPVDMSFETTSVSLNYNWYTLKQGSDVHLNPVTNTTGLYTFIPTTVGTYTIYLNAYKNNECQFEFTKTIVAKSCEPFVSCTKTNRNTPVIKNIFTTLINKLISLPAASITNGYTCDELTALSSYIKDKKPAIYNFTRDTQQGFIAFSFSDHAEYDVKIALNGSVAAAFNLDNYESDTIETELRTGLNDPFRSFVNHIDFCSGLYCVSHIAFVVDESGSISDTEASRIKKQLKKYIQQQADDNDKLQSNVYVSLIGMSDNDANNRNDHVEQIRVTNDQDVIKKFNNWIDNYGAKNGVRRVSASSDYWKSGLDFALESEMKPSVVIMITDGCQTKDVNALRDGTMSKFNNSKNTTNTSTDKPHLYVLGIENGFYVDGGLNGIALSNNDDPNYNPAAATASIDSRVVPNLRTSLKYLLDYPVTEFPQSDMVNFRDFDYYGYENFNLLVYPENEAFLSDNLKLSGFSCGKPTDKNYCSDCLSFQPVPGKEYMLSAWVKEESTIQVKTYENAAVKIHFYSDAQASELQKISTQKLIASGDIIDGWQRINGKFLIPEFTKTISIELENNSNGIAAYFDDIRIHPIDGSIKTFVYDSETFKLMSELDENNYSTFYEYDNEGGLVRVKKETSKGIKTIQETRSGNYINN